MRGRRVNAHRIANRLGTDISVRTPRTLVGQPFRRSQYARGLAGWSAPCRGEIRRVEL
jgi:hypothetical protein